MGWGNKGKRMTGDRGRGRGWGSSREGRGEGVKGKRINRWMGKEKKGKD